MIEKGTKMTLLCEITPLEKYLKKHFDYNLKNLCIELYFDHKYNAYVIIHE